MASDVFLSQCRTRGRCCSYVEGDAALDRVSAKRRSGTRCEQPRRRIDVTLGEPGAECFDHRDSLGSNAILATLTLAGEMCADADVNVALSQADQL